MSKVKVSVIVPCYQCAQTIARTIQSIQQQTEPSWELICVDDGSTDETGAVLDRLALDEPRMRVIHQENGGVSAARNAGMRAARGEWLAFADADDLLEPHALAVLLSIEKEECDVLCAGFTMRYIDEGGRTQKLTCASGDLQTIYESLIRGDSALNPMYAKLYRRSMVEREGLLVPAGVKIGEDVLFNLRAFSAARIYAMTEESVYIYEYGGSSAMTRARGELFLRSVPMLDGIDAFLEERLLKTALFRAHIDAYIRILRADYSRVGAALRLSRAMVRRITRNVRFGELCAKQKCYYLALRVLPALSYFLP